jgi:hypothetical protein
MLRLFQAGAIAASMQGVADISLWFAAMEFTAVSLGRPPSFLTEHGWHLCYFDAAPIIWSGMMSMERRASVQMHRRLRSSSKGRRRGPAKPAHYRDDHFIESAPGLVWKIPLAAV